MWTCLVAVSTQELPELRWWCCVILVVSTGLFGKKKVIEVPWGRPFQAQGTSAKVLRLTS